MTTKMYECPNCAFSFDAMHTNADGTYSCPACAESRLAAERDEARRLYTEENLLRVRVEMERDEARRERDEARKQMLEFVSMASRKHNDLSFAESALERLRVAAAQAKEALLDADYTLTPWSKRLGTGDVPSIRSVRAALASLEAALGGGE